MERLVTTTATTATTATTLGDRADVNLPASSQVLIKLTGRGIPPALSPSPRPSEMVAGQMTTLSQQTTDQHQIEGRLEARYNYPI